MTSQLSALLMGVWVIRRCVHMRGYVSKHAFGGKHLDLCWARYHPYHLILTPLCIQGTFCFQASALSAPQTNHEMWNSSFWQAHLVFDIDSWVWLTCSALLNKIINYLSIFLLIYSNLASYVQNTEWEFKSIQTEDIQIIIINKPNHSRSKAPEMPFIWSLSSQLLSLKTLESFREAAE